MSRLKRFALAATVAALVAAAPFAGAETAEPEGPVAMFTKSADFYHRKVVSAEGVISSRVKTKTYRGKEYTVFKMRDPDGKGVMAVYLRGFHTELKTGDRLRVRGRFYEKRRYLFIRFKNVLKGREFVVLP